MQKLVVTENRRYIYLCVSETFYAKNIWLKKPAKYITTRNTIQIKTQEPDHPHSHHDAAQPDHSHHDSKQPNQCHHDLAQPYHCQLKIF